MSKSVVYGNSPKLHLPATASRRPSDVRGKRSIVYDSPREYDDARKTDTLPDPSDSFGRDRWVWLFGFPTLLLFPFLGCPAFRVVIVILFLFVAIGRFANVITTRRPICRLGRVIAFRLRGFCSLFGFSRE